MHKRKALGEIRWPSDPRVDEVRLAWTKDAVDLLLHHVWSGYDALRNDILNAIDVSKAEDDLERSLTQALEIRIRRSMTGAEPYAVQHGRYEHVTRKAAPAQPPQYDLAFVPYANENVCWPFEAKVLKSDSDVKEYVRDVLDQFLSCRYAPLSAEGAMIGYLMCGSTDSAFVAISQAVPCALVAHPGFAQRPHRISEHARAVPEGESFAPHCRCHHLLMPLS